jgi:hypothetical protein
LSGHAIIGTPLAMLSTAEFQPQCVKNPPPDGWFKISVCRGRIETTAPIFRADLLSVNEDGYIEAIKSIWECDRDCFLKCFLFRNVSK